MTQRRNASIYGGGAEPLIPKHGGYRKLKSFQVAQLAFDITVRFCDRYVDRRSRTHDQMVQAARSGVQNIAEGSMASGTSRKMEFKLTNVARASLEELRLDYEDFLRHRRLPLWPRDDPRGSALVARRCTTADDVARWVKGVVGAEVGGGARGGESGPSGQGGQGGRLSDTASLAAPTACSAFEGIAKTIRSAKSTKYTLSTKSADLYAEPAANAALVLVRVAIALLDRQVTALAAMFEEEGGFTERLYRVRRNRRRNE